MEILKVFLINKEVFGSTIDKERVIELIEDINTFPITVILSKLSYCEIGTHEFDQFFVDSLKLIYPGHNYWENAYSKLKKDRILFVPQGIEMFWKWIYKYSKYNNSECGFEINHSLYQTFQMMLILHEQLNKNLENRNDLLINECNRNIYYNAIPDDRAHIARSFFMFLDDKCDNELSKNSEYVDIKKTFEEFYGFTIREYFTVILSIHFMFNSNNRGINDSWLLDYEEYFKSTSLSNVAGKIIKLLTIDDSIENWLDVSINNDWDVEYFFDKPLVKTENNKIYPISSARMKDQLHNALFFRIGKSFKEKHNQFNVIMGRAFENYVTWVAKETEMDSYKTKYKLIEEFNFKKGQLKSPDLMIVLGNKVLVFEVKLRRLAYDGLGRNNDELLKLSQEKIIYDSTFQAINAINRVIEFNACDVINKNSIFYFLIVTPDLVPCLGDFQDNCKKIILKENLPINYIGNVDIEEYEWLIEYMYRKNSKPIFRFLDRLFQDSSYISIKNEMISSSMYPKRPSIVQDYNRKVFDDLINEIKPSKNFP